MLELERELAARLEKKRVRINVTDDDTVVLRNVPTNHRFFNKPRTNVLLKRPRTGVPFLVCVDEDLEYGGQDAALVRAFAAGPRQQGWRIIGPAASPQLNFQTALEHALNVLGFDGEEPRLALAATQAPADAGGTLLASHGRNLSQLVAAGHSEPTVSREDEIDAVLSCVLRWGQMRLPLIVGHSGVGKTNLLHGIAQRLARSRPQLQLLVVDLGGLLAGTFFDAERENLLDRLLKEATENADLMVAIEHLELASPDVARRACLICQYLDRGARLIGTTLPDCVSSFGQAVLQRRVQTIELSELAADGTLAVLQAVAKGIAEHHHVEIAAPVLPSCVRTSMGLEGCQPAKAVALLDAAACRAAVAGSSVVSLDDVYSAAATLEGAA